MCLSSIIKKNLSGVIAELTSKINAVAANLYKNYYTKLQIDTKLLKINADITAANNSISTVDNRITSSIASVNTKIANLDAKITSSTPDVSKITVDKNGNFEIDSNEDGITVLNGNAIEITPTGGNVVILDLSYISSLTFNPKFTIKSCNRNVVRKSVEFTFIVNAGNFTMTPVFDSSIKFDGTPITKIEKNKYYEISINTITGLCLYKES